MRRTQKARLGALAAAVTAAIPLIGLGQTSGSWVVNADGNWSTASNWDPAVPDSGGVATFNQLVNQNVTRNTTLDVNISLAGIVYNSGPRWIIPVTGASVLTLQGSGVNPGVLTSNISAPNSPSAFSFGPTIIRPIAGANGLTKTGPGNLTLQGTNTYTGGTNVNQGMLLSTTGDAALGTGGAANAINMNGGIWAYATTAVTSARNVNLSAGGGTFLTLAAGTFSGVFGGSGSFNKLFSSTMAFQAANTYTGATNLEADGTNGQWGQTLSGTVIFQASGTALATSAINSSATISLDNAATNINGRLNPAAPVALHGVGVAVIGNLSVPTVEALGAVTGDAGTTFMTVTPNAAQPAALTLASFTRSNRNTQVYRATGLGNTPGVGVGNIFLTAAPTLTGGGGAAGSQNISIIVGATGGVTATNLGTDMVTYGATGVRPLSLAAGEYRVALGAGAATDNVRLAAATATAADETMNSLILNGALTGANTLTLTSGMLINNTAATHTANIGFGAAEGIIHTTASATFGGVLSGSNGITKSGGLTSATFNGANTYSGNTTIVSGSISFNQTAVPINTAGPFGSSNDPIVLEPGGGVLSRLWFSGVGGTVFDRPLIARGNGAGSAAFGVTGSQTITMNGNVTLERQLDIEGSTTGLIDFTGVISGTGRLTDRFSNVSRFTRANTFSGGIEVNTGSYYAADDAAFGTGRIYMTGIGTIGASGAPRTIANPITILAATVNIGSSALVGGGQNITFTGPVDLSGLASITFAVPANITARFDGVMSNGAIVKTGAGTLRLTAANTYIGGTIVNVGSLQVDNTSGSGTGAGQVVVNSGAFLSGVGTIADTVTMAAGSNLSPGDSPGTLTSGNMVLNNTTNLLYELSTPGFSASNDLMAVNGALTLDGALTVTALATLQSGLYPLFTYSGALTDNTVTINPLPQGGTGSIDTTTTPGVVYLNFTAVPEPATIGLFAVAGLGSLARRRRRSA